MSILACLSDYKLEPFEKFNDISVLSDLKHMINTLQLTLPP